MMRPKPKRAKGRKDTITGAEYVRRVNVGAGLRRRALARKIADAVLGWQMENPVTTMEHAIVAVLKEEGY